MCVCTANKAKGHTAREIKMKRVAMFALSWIAFTHSMMAQDNTSGKEINKPPATKKPPARPDPTFADVAYGTDSERQKFDFWQAKSSKPTPVVLLIHGGGWVNGDKNSFGNRPIQGYLDAGISVAAINYRFIAQAMEQGVEPPVKACVYDAARALQTIRANAGPWNVDTDRIGAHGGSAGACTSLWLALHDDLADPNSPDPIARQSTRLTCVAVTGAQTSLDPIELREWISNANYGGHAFGFASKGRGRPQEFELLLANREKVLPWIKEYSPISLISKDDPPVFLEYPNQKTTPVLGGKEPDPTHSALYGIQFASSYEKLGLPCIVSYPEHLHPDYGNSQAYLIRTLKDQP
jgi:acetyl esterase/lipase